MQSTIGNSLKISLFGQSHGEAIGVVIDGIAPGIKIDMDHIHAQMEKRKPKGKISTNRHETDEIKIISGLFNEHTTGTPLCIIIENTSQHSKDYEKTKNIPRPSHADYTAQEKYLGFQDYRGGGHFSGRLTAPIVAAGAICLQILAAKGIKIGSHILKCYTAEEAAFSDKLSELNRQIELVNEKYFPAITEEGERKMMAVIEEAKAALDSVGGVVETAVTGIQPGLGEPFFNSVESVVSHMLFSVPAVKGVEFGLGFDFAGMKGSQANDPFRMEGSKIVTATNNNAGINGGITNGMPIKFRTVIKPTPSIYQQQQSVDMQTKKNVDFSIVGRHDPAIIHRARVVIDSVTAIALVDLASMRFGYLWQREA